MTEMNITELSGEDVRFKLSRTQPSLEIFADLIPEEYKYQVISQEIDKEKIKKDLKEGIEILGAELKENVALRRYNKGAK